jgi:hypothetical protein
MRSRRIVVCVALIILTACWFFAQSPERRAYLLGLLSSVLVHQFFEVRPVRHWYLMRAPLLMNEDTDEPNTGTPYLRAPLSDWRRHRDVVKLLSIIRSVLASPAPRS